MFYYNLYGQIIKSDIEFMQLVQTDNTDAAITIIHGEIPDEIKEAQSKYEVGPSLSWLSNKTCYLLVKNGNEIIYALKPDARESYMKSFILGYGMAMLFQQRGELAIHCSAISYEDKAILIAGRSGSGKSTLTSELLEKGFSLMADDMAIVKPESDFAIAFPAFPYQKLCRDAALANGEDLSKLIYIDENKDKFLVPFKGNFDLSGKHIAALFILAGEVNIPEVQLDEIKGFYKIPALANNLFMTKLLNDDKFKGECGQYCVDIAAKIPIYIIARPPKQNSVEEISRLVLEKLSIKIN